MLIAIAAMGMTAAIAIPASSFYRIAKAERAAAATLQAVADAQRAFRQTAGRGGYATELASLTRPCPGEPRAALAGPLQTDAYDYVIVLRAARRASAVGTDCHGTRTTSDFYAGVSPAHVWAGTQAMATTSWGRIYVFFDGIAPIERDMGAGGLAVPLDTLDSFKIP